MGGLRGAAGVRGPGVPAPAAPHDGELHDLARAWAERTCSEQGVPVKVLDRAVLTRVAALLREVSDAPDRLQARRIKPVETAHTGADDDLVQDRSNDGAPLVKVKVRPLSPQALAIADQAAD